MTLAHPAEFLIVGGIAIGMMIVACPRAVLNRPIVPIDRFLSPGPFGWRDARLGKLTNLAAICGVVRDARRGASVRIVRGQTPCGVLQCKESTGRHRRRYQDRSEQRHKRDPDLLGEVAHAFFISFSARPFRSCAMGAPL